MKRVGDHEKMSNAANPQPSTTEESELGPPASEINEEQYPPDGGWGWVVCFGVSLVNFLTVGQQNSAGVVYDALMDEYSTPRGQTGTGRHEFCDQNMNSSDMSIKFL